MLIKSLSLSNVLKKENCFFQFFDSSLLLVKFTDTVISSLFNATVLPACGASGLNLNPVILPENSMSAFSSR
jgi:hypothetical protein